MARVATINGTSSRSALCCQLPICQLPWRLTEEVEGFSLAELSETNGQNENTLKVRLFRVRQGLVAVAARLRCRRRSIADGAVQAVAKI